MLTLIVDITGIQVDKPSVNRVLAPKKLNQKPTNLALEMKAFKNAKQNPEQNCVLQ
jgi:hypothetical protein